MPATLDNIERKAYSEIKGFRHMRREAASLAGIEEDKKQWL
jgi:hypothetical protein